LSGGPEFDRIVEFYRGRGSRSHIKHAVLVAVTSASALISPAYDQGQTEEEISVQWQRHFVELGERRRRAET
jgi:hypothetical protein